MRNDIRAITKEREAIEAPGIRDIASRIRTMTVEVLRAVRTGAPLAQAIRRHDEGIIDVLTDGKVASHLTGEARSQRAAKSRIEPAQSLALPNVYRSTLRIAQARVGAPDARIRSLVNVYKPQATEAVLRAQEALERKLTAALAESIAEGDHVKRGIFRMRSAMTDAGVSLAAPFLYETLYRTELQLSYSAGRLTALSDPAIQSILWGFEYVAIPDARLRPNHAALDGLKLPQDDPQWATIMPPNGFNCRCSFIEIFNDEKPDEADVVPPEGFADKGFEFNPLTVLQ